MFNKALFKQSCKSNGIMWMIITSAVCFMLACVMLISGSGNIGKTKNAIQDTIIMKEIDSAIEQRSMNYYLNSIDGLEYFDFKFVEAFKKYNTTEFRENIVFAVKYKIDPNTDLSSLPEERIDEIKSLSAMFPDNLDFATIGSIKAERIMTLLSYKDAIESLQEYALLRVKNIDQNATYESNEFKELYGSIMFAINPPTGLNGSNYFDEEYKANNEKIPSEYIDDNFIKNIILDEKYIESKERKEFILERAKNCESIFIACNMTKKENVDLLLENLSNYGVDEDKYISFGYSYDSIKDLAELTIIDFQGQFNYKKELLDNKYAEGLLNEDEYKNEVLNLINELSNNVSESLLSSLPQDVSSALEEVGKLDLYSLIVGSIFYKLAGLLLPIIYMIMASNNLISGQVDTGSMAYVLSTSIKRRSVVFTQAVYLLGSLFLMFICTTITGFLCLCFVNADIQLTYNELLLLNLGAFLVLVALSGLCFFTSCFFDRSKRSMAIGGGLSIFSLVAAMLGLFGSPVIPSVVRLESLNYFNKVNII